MIDWDKKGVIAGTNVQSAIRSALDTARKWQDSVKFTFGGKTMVVEPNNTEGFLYQQWVNSPLTQQQATPNKRVIFKYPIDLMNEQVVQMVPGAQIIAVQTQGSVICLWAILDPTNVDRLVPRIFRIHGTGTKNIEANESYIGTVQNAGYVWHVFEVKEKEK